MTELSGYVTGGVTASTGGGATSEEKYLSLTNLKQKYSDYLGNKRYEIDEQISSRRYRHGAHWTADQVAVLNLRKQPVVTYNRIGRKIDGIVGLVERLRQDPKAYPRTPQHQQGADLATAVIRYVLDTADWKAKTPQIAEDGAVDGIGGLEFELIPGDHTNPQGQQQQGQQQQPDYDVDFSIVEPDGFFYDPRSFQPDFSDALYMGRGKWVDEDVLKDKFPDDDTDYGDGGMGSDLVSNSDRDNKWFFTTGNRRMVRLVDCWYKQHDEWFYCVFTGAGKLAEGLSPFKDEKGKTFCKFIMFSAAVDHDGDRYGFVRNLKSANDEINMRRSKGLHELNSRRMIAQKGAFDDPEKTRREAAKPDGLILYNPPGSTGEKPEFDDAAKHASIQGQLEFLKDAKEEIENFGPNPAVLGDPGLKSSSGRAIALLQQAGIAELGPYILGYRGWKLRCYRAAWNIVQQYWNSERWIRVTDDQGLAQFVSINKLQVGQDGMPVIVNAVGTLDVDIILDEGPDQINMMQDTHEFLSNVLPSLAPLLSPPLISAVMQVLIDTSPLPADAKKKFADAANAPQPQGPPPEVQAKLAQMQAEEQRDQGRFQLEVRKAELDRDTKVQAHALDAQAREAEAKASIERANVEALAKIQIADRTAEADMRREHAKALHGMQVNEATAEHKAQIESKSADHKAEIEKKAAKAKPKEDAKPDKSQDVIASLTKAVEAMSRPKKVSRGKDGSFEIRST